MKRLLTAAAITLGLITGANAGIIDYMNKTSAADKAVMATILAIHETQCDGDLPEKLVTLKKMLALEQAYTPKQVKTAIKNQAAFITVIGQKAWCDMTSEKFLD